MAITWGPFEANNGKAMRVGIDVSVSAVSHTSGSVTFNVAFYTENRHYFGEKQTLQLGGLFDGVTLTFQNNAGTGTVVHRLSRQHVYTYPAGNYGASPGTRYFSALVKNVENGIDPYHNRTVTIPGRPIAAPVAPSGLAATYKTDTTATLTWVNNADTGNPYSNVHVERWDNVGQTWAQIAVVAGNVATYAVTGLSGNRRYCFRLRASNVAGTSAYTAGAYVQTTPAAPSGASVVTHSASSVVISWVNNASSDQYAYVTQLERSVNGGAWLLNGTYEPGVTSALQTGLSAGVTVAYRVRTVSNFTTSVASAYSTTGSVTTMPAPAAPTGFTAARTSDAAMSLNWTNNPTSIAPYAAVTVQRYDNVTLSWTTIASLPGTATSLTDTSAIGNRRYQYQVSASNAAGASAWTTHAGYLFTTPAPVTNASASYTGGTSITAKWTNAAGSYQERTTTVTPYKNNIAQASAQVGGTLEAYTLTGIDITASYFFEIKTTSTSGLTSTIVQTNTVMGASAPFAPTNLAPAGIVADFKLGVPLTWKHNPSADGSAQRVLEVQHRLIGSPTWTSSGSVYSANSTWTLPVNAYPNGSNIEWQVRTYGVHTGQSPWSATATITGSTTPTVTLNTPGSTLPRSRIDVSWSYFDAESTAQSEYHARLLNGAGTVLLEEKAGAGSINTLTFSTAAIDGTDYQVSLRVRDGSGLWSNLLVKPFRAAFMLPAPVTLNADLDAKSGSVVLTLNPVAHDNGVTTLPQTAVTIQRRVYQPDADVFGEWETVAEKVAPNATIIDTTAPIHGDGHYRTITYSDAPSSRTQSVPTPPSTVDTKWLYVSGGPKFSVVCRMWANIEIGWKASRNKGLFYFAGRELPVIYSGEAKQKTLTVTGLATDDASDVYQWMRLAQEPGPVLLRAPGNRRIYGTLSEVSVDRINNDLHQVSFNIQEVSP